jgi:hypothetical protein
MKILKNLILVAIMVIGLMANASERKLNYRIFEIKPNVVQFVMNNTDGYLNVAVKDNFGYVFYKETFKGDVYSKKYDMKSLPDGAYHIEVDSYTKVKEIHFDIVNGQINWKEDVPKIAYKPIIYKKGTKVNIHMLAENNEPLNIEIYDASSELVYKEKLEGNRILKRQLDFSKLDKGYYQLFVSTSEKMIVRSLKF